MKTPEIATELRSLPFFTESAAELVEQLAAIAHVVELPAGSVIFRQGEAARSIYFVVEGQVSLELCAAAVGCKRILTVSRGELLGWSPILEQESLSATARALTPVRAIEIDGEQAVALCRHDPQIGYELMKRAAVALARRLNATRLQLLNVYGSGMPPVADERLPSAATS